MEKKGIFPDEPYSTAPPSNTGNWNANSRYTPPYFMPAQVVISTKPPIEPTTAQQYNPRYPPQYVEESNSWLDIHIKNKPQSNSIGATASLFISGGMNIAWSSSYTSKLYFPVSLHMRICWFIAAIIGAAFSAVLIKYVPKKPIYLLASILVTLGGILFISVPNDAAAITTALYLDGIANGLALVTMLQMAGEESIPGMRGKIASLLEVMMFSMGILLQIVFTVSFSAETSASSSSFGATDLHGLLSIIYGVISAMIAGFLVIESPVHYLERNDEDRAINSLRLLQRPYIVTHETYRLLSDCKGYVDSNRADPYMGLAALLKMCIYRGLCGLIFNAFMGNALQLTSTLSSFNNVIWPSVFASVLLLFGALIAGFSMDTVGRRKPMLFGALICGAMALATGIVFNEASESNWNAIKYLLVVLQIGSGFFLSAAPVYSTEAFPLRLKSYYIAITFIVQMLVMIITGACFTITGLADYFIAMGVLYLVYFILAYVIMPETRDCTLREAQDKFKNFCSKRVI